MRVHIATLFPDYFRGPFDCGPTRAALDIAGWQEQDIFAH